MMLSHELAGMAVWTGLIRFFAVEALSGTSGKKSGLRFDTMGRELQDRSIWLLISIPYSRDTFQLDGEVFLNSIRFRRSVRQFEKRPVEREKIDRIIESGRYTPTGMNVQNVRYVVMGNPAEKIEPYAIRAFSKAVRLLWFAGRFVRLPVHADTLDVRRGFFFHDAPAAIFVISESPVNAALALADMETMAEAQEPGVLFAGLFVRAAKMSRKIRDQPGIRGKEQLVTVLAPGYPAVKYQRTVPGKPAGVEYR